MMVPEHGKISSIYAARRAHNYIFARKEGKVLTKEVEMAKCKIVGFDPRAEMRDIAELCRQTRVAIRKEEKEEARAKAREFEEWNKKGLGYNPFKTLAK